MLQVGIRPSGGLRLWDIRFNGQRIVYELALQEAMMSGAGTTPSQVPGGQSLLQMGACMHARRSRPVPAMMLLQVFHILYFWLQSRLQYRNVPHLP